MCILFVNVDPNPPKGGYRLIVASNRDEYYKRPASEAREMENFIIGGLDMEEGREGGMWLAFKSKESENGKPKKHCFAGLLNITGEKVENAAGRGGIVPDYLNSTISFDKYAKELSQNKYNGYNFVAVELSKDDAQTFHHSNTPNISSVYSGKQTLGFGNSPTYAPLTKVQWGRNRFEEIVNSNLTQSNLVEELLSLLKDTTSHLPDVELQKRAPSAYNFLSSVFVKIPEPGYGTRTHTIVLIDYDWSLHFLEHTLNEPIDINNPIWNINQFKSML